MEEIEPQVVRFIVPMTTSQFAAATGLARRHDIDSDDLATLSDSGRDALHVETDTEEGVVVRAAFGADAQALRRMIEGVGGRLELPLAA